MINKDPIWVGSDAQGLNGVIENGLKLMRRYETFEGNRDQEYIKVVYTQWYEGENSKQYDVKWKEYFTKDILETQDILNDDGSEIIKHGHPAHLAFTSWYNQLGVNYIVPAINGTLKVIPQNVKDSYLTHPDNIDV